MTTPRNACQDCRDHQSTGAGAWMVVVGGGDDRPHWARRGAVSAAVDVAPHYMTACGLSLGDMKAVDW